MAVLLIRSLVRHMAKKFRSSQARDESRRTAPRSIFFPRLFRQTRLCWSRPYVWLALLTVLCLVAPELKARRGAAQPQWVAPAAEAQKQNPVPATDLSLASGQKIFEERCVSCHGKTGEGDGPIADGLGLHPAKFSDPAVQRQSDGALFWKTTTGKKPMPGYGSRLSATDRWNAINYLRTLARH